MSDIQSPFGIYYHHHEIYCKAADQILDWVSDRSELVLFSQKKKEEQSDDGHHGTKYILCTQTETISTVCVFMESLFMVLRVVLHVKYACATEFFSKR